MPSMYIYVEKESRTVSMFDIQVDDAKFRFRLHKNLSLDPNRFGIIDHKYHTWDCESPQNTLTQAYNFVNSHNVWMDLFSDFLGKIGMKFDMNQLISGLNQEVSPEQES